MLPLRKWSRRVATHVAAAFLLFGAASTAAQGADDFQPSEDDFLLLQLQVKKYRLLNEIRGYQTPGGACVDFADVIQSLDLPIRLDRKSRRATGWVFSENQTLSIDRDSSSVQIMNGSRPLQPGELYDTPEGWCIDTKALGGWFGVTFEPNLRDSVLALDSDKPLPFMEAMERKSRAARLRGERDSRDLSGYPQAPQPYAMWRLPSVDVVARADYRSGRARGLDTRYELFASGEIATASYSARLVSDSQGAPDSLRVRAFRMDPDARLLGPLRATQVVGGDVEMLSGSVAGASGVGRGLFLSNRALSRPSRFGTTVLRGTLPLGWEAELYRNGQLLAYQGDNSDGRYEFEVGLVFGVNKLEVVLYGPQGQVRREAQSIPVGASALPPGKIEYWAGIAERNRDLITFGRPPPGHALDRGWHYAAGVQFGLDRRTTIGASGHSLLLDARRRDYVEINLQRTIGPLLLNLSGAQELGQGRTYRAEFIGKLGSINVQGESFVTDGPFASGLIDGNESSSHRIEFDTVARVGRIPVPLSLGLRRSTQRDGRDVNELLGRASLILPRASLTGFVIRRFGEGGLEDDHTEVGVLANTRFLGFSARGEASYRLGGREHGFGRARLTLEKALSDRSDLRLAIDHVGRSRRTDFEAGYVRHFRQFSLQASGHADTRGNVGASLAVSFSLGPDELGGGWRLSSDKLAQRGQAAVSVFLDQDGDGRRSRAEKALPGVGITAGQHGAADPTDARGHAIVDSLQPYHKVLVSVDESTLPDPYLVPRGKGVVITPRPGVPARIELAISPTGEVEGTIDAPEGGALAGVELELVGADGQVAARTMSEYDGFFLFDRVAYGHYRLQLAPDSQAALGVASDLFDGIVVGPHATTVRLGSIRLSAATTIAQAPAAAGALP